MKRFGFILLCISLSTAPSPAYASDKDNGKDIDTFISSLMSRMTVQEKLGQLNLLPGEADTITPAMAESVRRQEAGGFMYIHGADNVRELQRIAVEETRNRIPLLIGADIVHGFETVFPIPLALSCTWDTTAVEKAARISAEEASAAGINWVFSPMVDIARDPRWGRIAEGNGEDPYLGSVLAKAYIKGYQGENLEQSNEVMACVKHFALYGASEAGKDYSTVDMSRFQMANGFLPPYKAAVEAGAGSIMTSFNLVDGIPATANKWLITDILREEWGFRGMVVSDYGSIASMDLLGIAPLKKASEMALDAGTDMDMVSDGYIGLEESLIDGSITMEQIDAACRRVLEAKYRLGLFADPYKYCDKNRESASIFTPGHRETAKEIATETFVLLKNENNLLPLSPGGKIALIGPLADAANNMCGMAATACKTENHTSLLDGFRKTLEGKADILYAKGCNIYRDIETEYNAAGIRTLEHGDDSILLSEAMAAASKADVIIAALGECAEMSGESASRTDLDLPDVQRNLLESLLGTGKPVVLLLFTGRPLTLSWENENIPAILNVWFPGSEAAYAVPEIVFGEKSPSGKLTVTFPRNVGQIPIYYNRLRPARSEADDRIFERCRSNYIDSRSSPLYPFGYGLSYTTFSYGDMELSSDVLPEGGSLRVSVDITNTGNYDCHEIVQLYIRDRYCRIARPDKELKDFRKVFIRKGETVHVSFTLTEDDLKYYDNNLSWSYEPGEFSVMVGPNSRDVQTMSFTAE